MPIYLCLYNSYYRTQAHSLVCNIILHLYLCPIFKNITTSSKDLNILNHTTITDKIFIIYIVFIICEHIECLYT